MAVQRLSNSGQSGYGYKSLIAGITPVPSVPTIGSATAVNYSSVNVAFTAPGDYAGVTYTATSNPGGLTGTSASSPILVTGLSELTEYTFTVTATNATGTSGVSAASSPVTTPAGDNGVMFPLGMVQVGSGGQSSIVFNSIPQTYKHLQIRAIVRSTTTGNDAWVTYALNGDTTATNYNAHYLLGDGTSATASSLSSGSGDGNVVARAMGSASGADNNYAPNIIDILDYSNTSKYKVVRNLAGEDNNGSRNLVILVSNLWRNTAAINSITFTTANNFAQYSSFTLYGIKGA